MGLGNLEISLENEAGVFYAGNELRGIVRIEINGNPKRVRGVKMYYKGQCKTHIRKEEGTGEHRRTVHYSSTEQYFDYKAYLCGGPGSEFELDPGYYEYPFQFTLPPDLPSSFEGSHGKVRYTMKACIDRPWKFDHETVRIFSVINVVDLNLEPPHCLQPVLRENHKSLCCLCCKSGPISATLTLPRTAFVPGETVPISAEADNKSRRQVDSSSVKLFQTITYHAQGRSESDTNCISKMSKGSIDPGESEVWNDPFFLPAMPPSEMRGCSYIDISYYLRFEVDPGSMAFDLDIDVPLLIGTIPLRSTFSNFAQPSGTPLGPHGTPMANPSAPPMGFVDPSRGMAPPPAYQYHQPPFATTYPDIPPPSYGEYMEGPDCGRDDSDNEYTAGNWGYRPKYITYGSTQGGPNLHFHPVGRRSRSHSSSSSSSCDHQPAMVMDGGGGFVVSGSRGYGVVEEHEMSLVQGGNGGRYRAEIVEETEKAVEETEEAVEETEEVVEETEEVVEETEEVVEETEEVVEETEEAGEEVEDAEEECDDGGGDDE